MVWYSHLFQNFPQFIVIHTVKTFGIVNKTEIDVFLELSCFFDDPTDFGNLISGSSDFSKFSLNIWKFTVHVLLKPDLENFEHYFTSHMHTYILSLLSLPSTVLFLYNPPIPPPRSSQSTNAELPVPYSSFTLAIYFTHGSVYMSVLVSQFIPTSPSYPVPTSPFSMSASLFLPYK